MAEDWLGNLKAIVRKKPLVVFQFSGDDWLRLRDSRRGVSEFTVARSHDMLGGLRVPTACLIFGIDEDTDETEGYFGIVTSRQAVSTLDSRMKIKRSVRISPSTAEQLLQLVTEPPHSGNLQLRLSYGEEVTVLSSKLSEHLVDKLAEIESNRGSMRAAMASLSSPKRYRSMNAMQEDAVQMALRAFGLSAGDQAVSIELMDGKETALARVNIVEDAVVEHDARHVPGYDLIDSDVTGHAVFERGPDRLDVYTANRRSLEKVFGVDLVYLNITRQNVVMVQYKMLEPVLRSDGEKDWVYRPDSNLDSEIERMRKFSVAHPPGALEYRLNPQVFYMKFVKRDGSLQNAGIIMPVDHFEQVRADPASKGPRGGTRVSFDALGGRYMRQGPFVDLIRSGYIGAHAQTTSHLKTLVNAIVSGNRALVAAIHTQVERGDSTRDYHSDDPMSFLEE
jgi:hypothetical protein